MTYRQKVISIYPDAHFYNGHNIITWKLGKYAVGDWKTGSYVYLSASKYTVKEAWKDAWNNIQQDMLRKLES